MTFHGTCVIAFLTSHDTACWYTHVLGIVDWLWFRRCSTTGGAQLHQQVDMQLTASRTVQCTYVAAKQHNRLTGAETEAQANAQLAPRQAHTSHVIVPDLSRHVQTHPTVTACLAFHCFVQTLYIKRVYCFCLQEIQPSGPNGATVTVGDFVRDILLEQVSCMVC